jgi:hypothetical protein
MKLRFTAILLVAMFLLGAGYTSGQDSDSYAKGEFRTIHQDSTLRLTSPYLMDSCAVYKTYGNGTYHIDKYDLTTSESTTVVSSEDRNIVWYNWDSKIYAKGDYICWISSKYGTPKAIGYFKLSTGESGFLSQIDYGKMYSLTLHESGCLFWSNATPSQKTSGIYMFDINNPERDPQIIFNYSRSGAGRGTVISTSGNFVVWSCYNKEHVENVHLYNIKSKSVKNITEDIPSNCTKPTIQDNRVYFTNDNKMKLYDIENDTVATVFPINDDEKVATLINPNGHYVVFDIKNINASLYPDHVLLFDPETKEIIWIDHKVVSPKFTITSGSCYGKKFVYIDGNAVKLFDGEEYKTYTIIDNSIEVANSRYSPRISGNTITWIETNFEEDSKSRTHTSKAFILK